MKMNSKYEYIYNLILDKIRNGFFKEGDTLPSEYTLMKEYNASRDTIRKSLQLLSNNGYIQKSKGKGSIIINSDIYNFEFNGIYSFKEVASKIYGKKVETIVHKCEYKKADNFIKKVLKLNDDNDMIWYIERVRNIDNEKIILDIDFINSYIIKTLDEKIVSNSLYEYIENELNLKISYAERNIFCTFPTDYERSLLDINNYNMLITVESKTFLSDTRLFQYTLSNHRPDKFRFKDFARRR